MSDITAKLRGRQISAVMTNGHQLLLHTACGAEITISWVDSEGRPIKGKPVAAQSGYRLRAHGLHDLMHLPRIRTHGEA